MNSSAMTSAPSPVPGTDLASPMPPDVIPGISWGPLSYRKFPVFSWRWLKRRTFFATAIIVAYATFSMLVHAVLGMSWSAALVSWLYFVAGCFVMVTAGPAIGAVVRHQRWAAGAEAAGIIAAAGFGLIIAFVADYWCSQGILHAFAPGSPLSEDPVKPGSAGLDIDRTMTGAMMALFAVASVFFHFAISGGVAAFAYFSERRRLRARAMHLAALDADMKLAVLQAQIEPHFLFNTLATIRPLIRQDAAQAESALDALADHLRATIPQMRSGNGRVMSTLGQQLDICASYLAVMQVRMGARLHQEMRIPSELRAMEFPPLMLLSLVENAIKHGLEPKPGPGMITIRATLTGGQLRVSVSDDGQGLKDGLTRGLGLANIREQLQVRYDRRASLAVAARPEGGTVAEIMVPAHA